MSQCKVCGLELVSEYEQWLNLVKNEDYYRAKSLEYSDNQMGREHFGKAADDCKRLAAGLYPKVLSQFPQDSK